MSATRDTIETGFWNGKAAIVTGASAGLGRAIAAALLKAGARVAIAARNADALASAAGRLEPGDNVLAVPTDVTSAAQARALVEKTLAHFGRLDLLINNAGKSMRGHILDTSPDEFRDLWDVNLLGVVHCTQAAAGHLIRHRGHLVNIGSLASKSAARYMGAYPTTKFALAGYTQQLRLELQSTGLHVMLVCPGPIAKSRLPEWSEEELKGLPPSASGPGAGVRARAIDPDWLARRIVRACRQRKRELVFPRKARLLFALMQLSPRLGESILGRFTS